MAEKKGEEKFNPLEDLVMLRVPGVDLFNNMHANIIHMFPNMVRQLSLACRRQAWPELFSLMTKGDQEKTPELLEHIRRFHWIVAEMMRASDALDPEGKQLILQDNSVYDTLNRLEWKSVPVEARTTYLAMLGLYLVSRIWALGRQNHALKDMKSEAQFLQGSVFEAVAAGASECFRNYEQGPTSVPQAQATLANAAILGKACGLTEDQIIEVVRHTYRTTTDVVPDMDILSRLGLFSL